MADEGGVTPSEGSTAASTGEIDRLLDSLTKNGDSDRSFLSRWSNGRMGPALFIVALLAFGVLASVVLSTLALSRAGDETLAEDPDTALGESDVAVSTDGTPEQIVAVLAAVGIEGIEVELRSGTVHLSGAVMTDAQRAEAIATAEALAGEGNVDASALLVGPVAAVSAGESAAAAAPGSDDDQGGDDAVDQRPAALQSEIDRVVAANPLIFDVAQSSPSEIQLRVLNNVAAAMLAYPDLQVTIVGHTDGQGTDENNLALSERRAEGVRQYLITQGVSGDRLEIEARGESGSTGADSLANLERRVEFEVGGAIAGSQLAPSDAPLRIAIVAPSARNDLAFTQSMVDAVEVIVAERGNVEVAITESTFVPSEAADAIRIYAEDDYDLIIAHGVEFAGDLLALVQDYPDVTFAWGTATDTFGLTNLYAYDAAAEEGGYVMGAMAAMLSESNKIGVVGPIEIGDAARYVNGFEAGARSASPRPTVDVEYTGSFGDITLAAETADRHVANGADVLSGTAEMVIGAIAVAERTDSLWFGTQANQASLAPSNVVASQVYRWEVVLRPIIADIDAGTINGRGQVATMANRGLVIEFNPEFDLPADVRAEAERLSSEIRGGALTVPGG